MCSKPFRKDVQSHLNLNREGRQRQVRRSRVSKMLKIAGVPQGGLTLVSDAVRLDRTDGRLLLELQREPRATVMGLADRLSLSRNTVQARLAKLERLQGFGPLGDGIAPKHFGYPLTAFITVTVQQRLLDEVADALRSIPEVVEVFGLSGPSDLLVRAVAADADDLYRLAGTILATPGIERTDTSLVMRPLVEHRLEPLLERFVHRDR